MDATPWVTNMRRYAGVHEMKGPQTHPVIVHLLDLADGVRDGKPLHGIVDDETPYCATAECGNLEEIGIHSPRTAWALDFAGWGQKLAGPAYGAIGVRKRNGGGHVTNIVGRTANGLIVGFGANQDDQFKESAFDLAHFVGWRWPPGFAVPTAVGFNTLPVISALNAGKVT